MGYLVDAPGRAAQELSWQLSSVHTRQQLRQVALEVLAALFQSDSSAQTDINPRRKDSVQFEIYPAHPATEAVARALSRDLFVSPTDNPVIHHYFGTPHVSPCPVRLSDLVSDQELRRTKTYREVLQLVGGNYQLVLPTRLDGPAGGTAFGLTRASTDFSDEALILAESVQPVLVAVEAALRVRDIAQDASRNEPNGVLTARELEVLQLVAAGLTAQAIGHVHRISRRTVCKHMENAYAKLGVHDRVSAVAQARRLGLLP